MSRDFGSLRKLPSGRWRATYRHDGREYTAPRTFPTETQAKDWLTSERAKLLKGEWVDPKAGEVRLRDYSETWLASRKLADTTREQYRYLLDTKILPSLGDRALVRITPTHVRAWNAGLADHPSTAAKAYRLLSTIMRTAVTDEVLVRSPCRVKGAGTEPESSARTVSLAEMQAAVDAMPERLRAFVLLAGWCQLRRGELFGLRRRDIDLLHRTITVEQTRVLTMSGKKVTKEPKSGAGRRQLSIPPNIVEALEDHLERFVGPSSSDLVFTGTKGGPLSRATLYPLWTVARAKAGVPGLRLHDLRHTGLTLAAATGATVAELMHRAGHSSAAAALRYQHATKDRDAALAEAMAELAQVTPIRSHGSRTSLASEGPASP